MALKNIELRTGSWVKYQEKYYQVISIDPDGIGIMRFGGNVIHTLKVLANQLEGIKFDVNILRELEGYLPKTTEEQSNTYLVSLNETTKSGLEINWSLCFRELEGSWWIIIEDSSVTFEVIGEGEFYYLHDLQNIVSTFLYLDIIWKRNLN